MESWEMNRPETSTARRSFNSLWSVGRRQGQVEISHCFFFKKIQTITLSKSTDKICWCWEHRKLNQKEKEETCDRCSESGEFISAEDDGFASFYALIIEGWEKEPNRVSQKNDKPMAHVQNLTRALVKARWC